jgi:membrane protease YdiL (CAAX protease family)
VHRVSETEAVPERILPLSRWFAIAQAIAVSGVPTQIVVAAGLFLFTDLVIIENGALVPTLSFLASVTLLDTALIALLIRVFLELSGETSGPVFVGRRPVLKEILIGLAIVPIVLIAMSGVVFTLRYLVPSLQTVAENPYLQFMGSPVEATIFVVVVMLGGGIREELQRAFVLHRVRQVSGSRRLLGLTGVHWGLVLFSLYFGLLHWDQGADLALALILLGLFWGVLYLRRGSAMMGMANHAGFNGVQVALNLIRQLNGA